MYQRKVGMARTGCLGPFWQRPGLLSNALEWEWLRAGAGTLGGVVYVGRRGRALGQGVKAAMEGRSRSSLKGSALGVKCARGGGWGTLPGSLEESFHQKACPAHSTLF